MSNMVKKIFNSLLLLSCLGLMSCSSRISYDDCISTYAQKGNTDEIVKWGYQLCKTATDDKKSDKDRAWAICAVKQIPHTPSELAFKLKVRQCREK